MINLSIQFNLNYFECSSLTGENIKEIVYCMFRDCIENELFVNDNSQLFTKTKKAKKCIIF